MRVFWVMAAALLLGGVAGYLFNADYGELKCDLAKTSCAISVGTSNGVLVDMSPKPLEVMGKTTIAIKNLPKDIDDLKLRINGINMDMGTIIATPRLVDGVWLAEVALSMCVVESVMLYQISLYNGVESLNAFAEFSLAH